MAYGRTKVPPPATPFEEFMATASEKMIAAKLDFIEFLRELPPAAYAPPVSTEVIDHAAELTKGKVAEGGAATTDAVKQAVGPAQ